MTTGRTAGSHHLIKYFEDVIMLLAQTITQYCVPRISIHVICHGDVHAVD